MSVKKALSLKFTCTSFSWMSHSKYKSIPKLFNLFKYIFFITLLLFGSNSLFIQVILSDCINFLMSTIFIPPASYFCIKVFHFIFSGLLSQINAYIIFSIWLIVTFEGFGSAESTNINFGRANVFITVIFPINGNFLCCIVSGKFQIVLYFNLDEVLNSVLYLGKRLSRELWLHMSYIEISLFFQVYYICIFCNTYS